jgi:hypothetical protein
MVSKTDNKFPSVPIARDELDTTMFNAMMQRGLDEAKANNAQLASDFFSELRQELLTDHKKKAI